MNEFGYMLKGQLIYCDSNYEAAKPIIRTFAPQGNYHIWYDWIEEENFIYQSWQMEEINVIGGENK